MSRLAVVACYDHNGIADDYLVYLIRDLSKCVDDIYLVFNGNLTEESRVKFKDLTDNIFVRENKGFDAGAWKYVLCEVCDWEKVKSYDELILLNDTFFGPFYPFSEVFSKMDDRPVDFWGMTSHNIGPDQYGLSPYGYCPRHIQSYFIVIRKRLLTSPLFREYWQNQKTYGTFAEVVCNNEYVFTKYFEDNGFKWDVLINTTDLDLVYKGNGSINHYAFNQYELLKRGTPILKRKNFSFEYEMVLNKNNGSDLSRCIDYIRKNTDYDLGLIFGNVLRNYNIYDIRNNLCLEFVLSKESDDSTERVLSGERAVVVVHLYYEDGFDKICKHLRTTIPDPIDLIITTNTEGKKVRIEALLRETFGDRVMVLIAPSIGRDMAGLLIAAKSYLDKYEYICFTHDKQSSQNAWVTIGQSFQDLIFENTISSPGYITNIIKKFKERPEIGLMCVPTPKFAGYYWGVGNEWTVNYDNTVKMASDFNIKCNLSANKPPLSLGTSFWCRKSALSTLFDIEWEGRFLPEPLPVDGTISHSIERIFPYVAQSNGFLTALVMSNEYAEMEVTKLDYMLTRLSYTMKESGLFSTCASFEDFNNRTFQIVNNFVPEEATSIKQVMSMLKRTLVNKIGIVDNAVVVYLPADGGYSETNSIKIKKIKRKNFSVNLKYRVPSGLKEIRIDPSNQPCIINSVSFTIGHNKIQYQHNGIRKSNAILFNSNDPSFILSLPEEVYSDGAVLSIRYRCKVVDDIYKQLPVSHSKIYFSSSGIYEEAECVCAGQVYLGTNKMNYRETIAPGVKYVRFDPTELPCSVRIDSIMVDDNEVEFTYNGKLLDNKIIFESVDPQIEIILSEVDGGEHLLKIKSVIDIGE